MHFWVLVYPKKLEIQLEAELELSWIISRGRRAVILAAFFLIKCIYRSIERIRRRFVEPIEEVEALRDQLDIEAFVKANATRNTSIERHIVMRDAHIAAKVSIRREYALQAVRIDGRCTKTAVRTDRRPLVRALEITVRIARSDDIERPAGAELKDRRERKAVHEPLPAAL